jgi:hypothetical protein
LSVRIQSRQNGDVSRREVRVELRRAGKGKGRQGKLDLEELLMIQWEREALGRSVVRGWRLVASDVLRT